MLCRVFIDQRDFSLCRNLRLVQVLRLLLDPLDGGGESFLAEGGCCHRVVLEYVCIVEVSGHSMALLDATFMFKLGMVVIVIR